MNSIVAHDSPRDIPDAGDVVHPMSARRGVRRWWLWGVATVAFLLIGWEAAYVLIGPNYHCVTPGQAYRSAQPRADWLRRTMAREGIRSVINLRGQNDGSKWYDDEKQAVLDSDGCLQNVMLSAAFAPHQRDLRLLLRVFDGLPKPVLIHCHAGADRTGLAAAIFLLLYTDTPIGEARNQLSWRYGHMACGRSACLQDVLDQYEEWLASQQVAHQPARLREWIMHVYRKAT